MLKRKWKEVYERLPRERKNQSLTAISGFTNFCSDPKAFRLKVLQNLYKEFNPQGVSNVCEVGCGCGDKLSFFHNLGHNCFGIDYSKNMIKRAKIEMPKAKLHAAEACELPFKNNSMDFVFSYSVFVYFENQEYVRKVLEEIYRVAKPEATICLWDIPDIREKETVLSFRGEHQEGYEHTYYDMNDFIQWFKSKSVPQVKSEYILIPEYRFSQHRFNITAKLNKKAKRGR